MKHTPSDTIIRSAFEANGATWNMTHPAPLGDIRAIRKASGRAVHYRYWADIEYAVHYTLEEMLTEKLDLAFRGLSRPDLEGSLVILTTGNVGSCSADSPTVFVRAFVEITGGEMLVHDICAIKDPKVLIPFKVILRGSDGQNLVRFREGMVDYEIDCASDRQARQLSEERDQVIPMTVFPFRKADGTRAGNYSVFAG